MCTFENLKSILRWKKENLWSAVDAGSDRSDTLLYTAVAVDGDASHSTERDTLAGEKNPILGTPSLHGFVRRFGTPPSESPRLSREAGRSRRYTAMQSTLR
jgi:hypothetical protein